MDLPLGWVFCFQTEWEQNVFACANNPSLWWESERQRHVKWMGDRQQKDSNNFTMFVRKCNNRSIFFIYIYMVLYKKTHIVMLWKIRINRVYKYGLGGDWHHEMCWRVSALRRGNSAWRIAWHLCGCRCCCCNTENNLTSHHVDARRTKPDAWRVWPFCPTESRSTKHTHTQVNLNI